MKIYLQTRGVAHDYAFLGEASPDYWWAVPFYKDATSFEQPSLILECGKPLAGEWRCFISAIPSGRRDCVNTPIRYSIALSGDGGSDKDVLLKLLASVLNIFNKNPVSEDNSLTKLLDNGVGVHADKWLGVNSEQVRIRDHINELATGFDELAPDLTEPLELLQELLTNAQNSPRRAAILNFIGEKDDLSAKHLQFQAKASDCKILILPSPVAGGQLKKSFVLEGNSPKKDINHTRQPVNESETEVSGAGGDRQKKNVPDTLKKGKAKTGSVRQPLPLRSSGKKCEDLTEFQRNSSQDEASKLQDSVAEKDSSKTFPIGPQVNNQRTEGHNNMGSSFATSDVRGGSNAIVLIVAAAIILVMLVVAGCYLAQNWLEVTPDIMRH